MSKYLWKFLLHRLQEEEIYIVDDLHMARKQSLYKWNGPFLQSFLHNSMICITECGSDDLPSLIPLKVFNINEQSLQFNDRQCGMRIIQLNCNLIRKFRPRSFGLLETTDDIVKRSTTPEILLL